LKKEIESGVRDIPINEAECREPETKKKRHEECKVVPHVDVFEEARAQNASLQFLMTAGVTFLGVLILLALYIAFFKGSSSGAAT